MELEFHQLDLRYEGLRVRRAEREHRLLAALAEWGQQRCRLWWWLWPGSPTTF